MRTLLCHCRQHRVISCFRRCLAEVGLHDALLLGGERGSCLCEVDAQGLEKGFRGADDAVCGLALESLGLEGLGNILEGFGGLVGHGEVLSAIFVSDLSM